MIYTKDGFDPFANTRDVKMTVTLSDGEITFSNDDIVYLCIEESLDLSCESFPSRKMRLEVLDRYNLTPLDNYNDCAGKQIEVTVLLSGEEISLGKFYIDKIVTENASLTAVIYASDIVKKMQRFMTGLSVVSPMSLNTIISLGSGAVAEVEFSVDWWSGTSLVHPAMTQDVDTQRRCLLWLAQASAMSSIWTDRSGIVHIEHLGSDRFADGYLKPDGIIEYTCISREEQTDYVEIKGSNPSGIVAGKDGRYFHGCNMSSMKNDFMLPANAAEYAAYYRELKNKTLKIGVRTRCNPAIEISDSIWVPIPGAADRYIQGMLTGQKITFDKNGLFSDMLFTS